MKPNTSSVENFKVKRVASPLRQSVMESIRNAIATGHFKAGERLVERDLCEMTGVSRTLVREVLRQLEAEGLIEVVAHRGPVVAEVTIEQAEGIFQVRQELEGLASQLFVENATDADRAALAKSFQELKQAMDQEDAMERLNAKNNFYDQLISGAHNEALGITLRLLNSRVMVLRSASLLMPGRSQLSMAELGQLMDALLAGDGKRARKAAVKHVKNAGKSAIASLKQSQAAVEGAG